MGVFGVVRCGGVCGVGWQRWIGFSGMGCRIFDGRVRRREFAMGVGSSWQGHMPPGTGEHLGGVGPANLGRLHGNIRGRSEPGRTTSWLWRVAMQ